MRALFAGETVADSLETKLLHESGRLPVFYFPLDDVRTDLLEPSGTAVEVPSKGAASYRTLRCGERAKPDAARLFEAPVESAGFLAGHLAFEWAAIDEWFTEDELVLGHPRDPYSRIEVLKYRDPEHDALPVADMLCFFNERVDLEVDGEAAERPQTQCSRTAEQEHAGASALQGLMGRR